MEMERGAKENQRNTNEKMERESAPTPSARRGVAGYDGVTLNAPGTLRASVPTKTAPGKACTIV